MATHIDRRDKTNKMSLEVIFHKSFFRPKNRPKGSKMGQKHVFLKYVIDVQYRNQATDIDRPDVTKKMPLEVIFQKLCPTPKSTPGKFLTHSKIVLIRSQTRTSGYLF